MDVKFDSGSITGNAVACDPAPVGTGNCFEAELLRIGRYHVKAANSIRRLLRIKVHLDNTDPNFDDGGAGYDHQNFITFETDDPDAADGTQVNTTHDIDLDTTYKIKITQLEIDAAPTYELKINIDGVDIMTKTMTSQIEEPAMEILLSGEPDNPVGEFGNFRFVSHDCDTGFIFNGRNCVGE